MRTRREIREIIRATRRENTNPSEITCAIDVLTGAVALGYAKTAQYIDSQGNKFAVWLKEYEKTVHDYSEIWNTCAYPDNSLGFKLIWNKVNPDLTSFKFETRNDGN